MGRAPVTIRLAVRLLLRSVTRIFLYLKGGGGGGGGEGFHVRFVSGSPAKGKRKYGLISNYVGGDIRSGTLQYKQLQ